MIRVSEKEYVALFLRFLRQSLQTEFQPRVDLKMYLNSWTPQTYYFNYSDIGRNLLKQPSKTPNVYMRFMHIEYFMCAKILFSSRSRIYNNIYSYMSFTLKLYQWDTL